MYNFIDWCSDVNLGSYKKLEILPLAWINRDQYSSLVTSHNRHLYNIPVLSEFDNIGLGGWIQIPVLPTRGRSFTETQINNFQGEHFRQQISCIYPSNREEARRAFNQLFRHRFIARVTEWDDTMYIVGTDERPCTMTAVMTTGASKSALKNWQITLRTRALHPAPSIILTS